MIKPKKKESVYIREYSGYIILGNKFLERVMVIKNKVLETSHLVNRLSGKIIKLDSNEFSIKMKSGVLTNIDFVLVGKSFKNLSGGGKQLIFSLRNERLKVAVQLFLEIHPDDFYMRKWIHILSLGNTEEIVYDIDVERFKILSAVKPYRRERSGRYWLQDFGQPVLVDSFFFGLEYPLSENDFSGEVLYLRHHPGRKLGEGGLVSKRAVVGVGSPAEIYEWFMKYISRIRVSSPKLLTCYNTWWTTFRPTERACLKLIDYFKKNLYDTHGEIFKTFVVDAGWQDRNSIWGINKRQFPRGFAPLVKRLKEMNSNLGIWISPSGMMLNPSWGKRKGFEVCLDTAHFQHEGRRGSQGYYLDSGGAKGNQPASWYHHYCLAATKYREMVKAVILDLVERYDLAHLKFDFFNMFCSHPDHGHLPGGLYSMEANVDARIDLITALRKRKPDIFIEDCVWMWQSPWWLMYDNTIYYGGGGDHPICHIPGSIPRESAITERDIRLKKVYKHFGLAFPIGALDCFGLIVPKDDAVGCSAAKWEDDLMIGLGRGAILWTLYGSPSLMDEKDLEFLANALKWAREKKEVLANNTLILGDPSKAQSYGYSHFSKEKNEGLIFLRNPFFDRQKVEIILNKANGVVVRRGEEYSLSIIYPYRKTFKKLYKYGNRVKLEVKGYEVLVLEVLPKGKAEPITVVDHRYSLVSKRKGRITYDIWGKAGTKRSIKIISLTDITEVEVDGETHPLKSAGIVRLPLDFEGDTPRVEIVDVSHIESSPYEIKGSMKATLSGEIGSELIILCELERYGNPYLAENNIRRVFPRIMNNGVRQKVNRFPMFSGDLGYLNSSWLAFRVPLTEGQNKINFWLKTFFEDRIEVKISSWLEINLKLKRKRINVKYRMGRIKGKNAHLSLPHPGEERDIIPIHRAKRVVIEKTPEEVIRRKEVLWPREAGVGAYDDGFIPLVGILKGYGYDGAKKAVKLAERSISSDKSGKSALSVDETINMIKHFPSSYLNVFLSILSFRGKIINNEEVYKTYCSHEPCPCSPNRVSDIIAELEQIGLIEAPVVQTKEGKATRRINVRFNRDDLRKLSNVISQVL